MIHDFGEFGSKLKSFGDKPKPETSVLAIKSRRERSRDMKANLMDFMMGERLESGRPKDRKYDDSNEEISDFTEEEKKANRTSDGLGLNLISITNMNQKSNQAAHLEAKGY